MQSLHSKSDNLIKWNIFTIRREKSKRIFFVHFYDLYLLSKLFLWVCSHIFRTFAKCYLVFLFILRVFFIHYNIFSNKLVIYSQSVVSIKSIICIFKLIIQKISINLTGSFYNLSMTKVEKLLWSFICLMKKRQFNWWKNTGDILFETKLSKNL